MNVRLSWKELASLKLGACIAFVEPLEVRTTHGSIEVEPGTVCTIEQQGLDEMWCGLVVRPVNPDLRTVLTFYQDDHNGAILVSGPGDGCPSPFVLDDSCPLECI